MFKLPAPPAQRKRNLHSAIQMIAVTFTHLVLVVLPVDAESRIYHVDQNHPQANDDNPGTQERPWLTIKKAAASARAGDTVLVHEGVYREEISLSHSG